MTEPHWDYFGVPQVIMHASGVKLWLVWPPTEKNIKVTSEKLLSGTSAIDFTIGMALELLNGLELYLCTDRNDYFTLAPNTIHAVISVTHCSHKNKLFMDYTHFDT
jgi:hypothetical protein